MNTYAKMKKLYTHGVDADAFLSKENEWDYLYNMSPVRQNILEWYDFKEEARVLELGAGTGIITELLLKKGLKVTPVEEDEEKKEIHKARFESLGSDVCPVRDISVDKPVEHSYDYVTIIDSFTKEYLDEAVRYIKPAGKLFIAIENKYAKPYWSRRDVSDIPSLDDLEKMLNDKGLVIKSIYYPSPDHILPLEIKDVAEGTDSSSYLLVCEKKGGSGKKEEKLIYAKYNSFRKPEFQISTYIKEGADGKRYAVKHPMTEEAKKTMEIFQKSYDYMMGNKDEENKESPYYKHIRILKGDAKDEGVIFPYLKGNDMAAGVDISKDTLDIIKNKLSYAMDIIFDINDDYFSTFEGTKEFAKVFGAENVTGLKTIASKTDKKIKALKASNYDCVFENFIKADDGIYCLDYEWFFDFPIPVSFLKYRALSVFYHDNEAEFDRRASREDFMKLFGFNQIQMSVFDSMEENFQEYVFGKKKERLYLERYRASNAGHEKRSNSERFNKSFHKIQMIGKSRVFGALNQRAAASDEYKSYQERRLQELSSEVEGDYNTWIRKCDSEIKIPSSYDYNPLISVVVYDINYERGNKDNTVNSVKDNRYTNHEITSINSVSGEYVLFIKRGDMLSHHALSAIAGVINEDEDTVFIYADEDIENENGIRESGFMKPDWSPDTFYASGYTGTMGVFKTSFVKDYIEKHVSDKDLMNELSLLGLYKMVLYASKEGKIRHISRVLYHTGSFDVYTDRQILERYLDSCNINAKVTDIGDNRLRVIYDTKFNDRVSIIIPSKDNIDVLKTCIESIVTKNNRGVGSYEIIIVDNGSTPENKKHVEDMVQIIKSEIGNVNSEKIRPGIERIEYKYAPQEFNFSKMCNLGAEIADGTYLLFLNDDIEPQDDQWLGRMLGQAEQPGTGAVGAKLLYPDTKLIQHDGIVNRFRDPVHLFMQMDDDKTLYFGYNKIDRDVLAVTGACLMVSAEKFNYVGGFDEELPVAYNAIDLCFRLHEAGYINVIRNDAVLEHRESMSRGLDITGDKLDRLLGEKNKLYEKHPQLESSDPYYSPYLTQIKADADYAFERFVKYDVTKTTGSDMIKKGNKLLCEVDMARVDTNVVIEGWAFEPGSLYNPDMNVELLLERIASEGADSGGLSDSAVSGDAAYTVTTTKKRRPDVVEKYSSERSIDFSGYVTRFDKSLIEKGTYRINVLYEGKKYPTPETITL